MRLGTQTQLPSHFASFYVFCFVLFSNLLFFIGVGLHKCLCEGVRPLELELQAKIDARIEPRSSGRAANALNC